VPGMRTRVRLARQPPMAWPPQLGQPDRFRVPRRMVETYRKEAATAAVRVGMMLLRWKVAGVDRTLLHPQAPPGQVLMDPGRLGGHGWSRFQQRPGTSC
jgi:hypothetical protein